MAVRTLDYTPTYPTYPSLWMGGYGGAQRGNHGTVARRLKASCVVFDDGSGTKKAMLRIDVVSIAREIHQQIRAAVLPLVGNVNGNFLITCSHTHSGPMIGVNSPHPYVMMSLNAADISAIGQTTTVFINQLVALVQNTLSDATTPVNLGYATGSVTIGYNRAELPTVLTEVQVLTARRTSNNSLFALLYGYGCHAVSRGNDDVFDSDYCGFAAEAIGSALGIGTNVFFFQGAAGDQDPEDPHQASQVNTLGQRLANKVVDIVNNGTFTPVTGPISTRYNDLLLPLNRDLGNPAAIIELRNKYTARMAANPPESYDYRHAKVMVDQIAGAGVQRYFFMPIEVWKFGGLNIVALAHEVLSVYETRIKALTGTKTWVMGYSNEIGGYVGGDTTIRAGETKHFGYEGGWTDDPNVSGAGTWTTFYAWAAPLKLDGDSITTPGGPSTEQAIVDAAAALINQA
ncbi:hypothetical protein [Actinosynnema sp. NPDC020468]|uniref:hypothetical protein n=1 Tax=Actinosynnema sp. NPDC020468 TaxID=3154488 RepID=UPI0033F9C58B